MKSIDSIKTDLLLKCCSIGRTTQGVYLLLQTTTCAALLAFLIIRRSRDSHLLWLAYALLALCAALCIVSLPVPVVGWAGTATSATDATDVANSKMALAKNNNEHGPAGYNSVTRPAKSAKSRSGGKRVNGGGNPAAAAAGPTPARGPPPPPPPPLPTVAAAEGLWPVVFATFVAYALLPLPTWLAATFGLLVGCMHLAIVAFLPTALPALVWQQIIGNCLVVVAVNAVGLFLHTVMENAQRKAFLDTRNCIAARLEIEDENEKLERLLLSVRLFLYLLSALLSFFLLPLTIRFEFVIERRLGTCRLYC